MIVSSEKGNGEKTLCQPNDWKLFLMAFMNSQFSELWPSGRFSRSWLSLNKGKVDVLCVCRPGPWNVVNTGEISRGQVLCLRTLNRHFWMTPLPHFLQVLLSPPRVLQKFPLFPQSFIIFCGTGYRNIAVLHTGAENPVISKGKINVSSLFCPSFKVWGHSCLLFFRGEFLLCSSFKKLLSRYVSILSVECKIWKVLYKLNM